jgi:hypothetical protein
MGLIVTADPGIRRIELDHDGAVVSYARCSVDGDTVVIDHVQTAPQHRGNGFAAQLMAGLLQHVRDGDRTVLPVCSYAVAYLRDHPDQHDLLA